MKSLIQTIFPEAVLDWFKRMRLAWFAWLRRWSPRTPFGVVPLGIFSDPRPVSASFGFDRGTPIDRWYIERFLNRNAVDIAGRVLEIGDRQYSKKFGGTAVRVSDVLHAVASNPDATLVGNLETGEGIPADAFDCMILTQTLHCIFDLPAAVRNVRKSLKTGGAALITVPCLSPVSRFDAERWGDYWRLTPQALMRVAETAFRAGEIHLDLFGNRTTGAAFLFGLTAEDLPRRILEQTDPACPMLLGLRLRKSG
jgi:SAM-dependent methyltransferase